jgi:hypothetical protein
LKSEGTLNKLGKVDEEGSADVAAELPLFNKLVIALKFSLLNHKNQIDCAIKTMAAIGIPRQKKLKFFQWRIKNVSGTEKISAAPEGQDQILL